MINRTQYQKLHTPNLAQNESDRKWRIFEEEQANFHMQTGGISSLGGKPSVQAPASVISYPVASWTATYSNVSINNGGNLIALQSGGVVSFYADYVLDYVAIPAACPFCIVQFYAGLVTDGTSQTSPLWCVSVNAGDAPTVGGSIFVNVNIPNSPGVYYISSTYNLNTSCDPTQVFTQDRALGIVIVQ